ncbi:mitosis inhibitor protein kinase swe1 [Polyrhizophydium stewartii]|uniref:Mitosis inhibitor protein kinase swe1 n=1 Tax=Polyrhizophydium stewartii TaxID=2732419 RepID=A0ABR4N4S7_9FUNG
MSGRVGLSGAPAGGRAAGKAPSQLQLELMNPGNGKILFHGALSVADLATPHQFKPAPSAFHSTGLISKRNRPRQSSQPTPETPIKQKRVSGAAVRHPGTHSAGQLGCSGSFEFAAPAGLALAGPAALDPAAAIFASGGSSVATSAGFGPGSMTDSASSSGATSSAGIPAGVPGTAMRPSRRFQFSVADSSPFAAPAAAPAAAAAPMPFAHGSSLLAAPDARLTRAAGAHAFNLLSAGPSPLGRDALFADSPAFNLRSSAPAFAASGVGVAATPLAPSAAAALGDSASDSVPGTVAKSAFGKVPKPSFAALATPFAPKTRAAARIFGRAATTPAAHLGAEHLSSPTAPRIAPSGLGLTDADGAPSSPSNAVRTRDLSSRLAAAAADPARCEPGDMDTGDLTTLLPASTPAPKSLAAIRASRKHRSPPKNSPLQPSKRIHLATSEDASPIAKPPPGAGSPATSAAVAAVSSFSLSESLRATSRSALGKRSAFDAIEVDYSDDEGADDDDDDDDLDGAGRRCRADCETPADKHSRKNPEHPISPDTLPTDIRMTLNSPIAARPRRSSKRPSHSQPMLTSSASSSAASSPRQRVLTRATRSRNSSSESTISSGSSGSSLFRSSSASTLTGGPAASTRSSMASISSSAATLASLSATARRKHDKAARASAADSPSLTASPHPFLLSLDQVQASPASMLGPKSAEMRGDSIVPKVGLDDPQLKPAQTHPALQERLVLSQPTPSTHTPMSPSSDQAAGKPSRLPRPVPTAASALSALGSGLPSLLPRPASRPVGPIMPAAVFTSPYPFVLDATFFAALSGDRSAIRRIHQIIAGHQQHQQEAASPVPDFFDTNFHVVSRIGGGAFSDAFRVRSHDDGREFAVKKTRHPFAGYKEAIKKLDEVRIWSAIGANPWCVSMVSAWIQHGFLFIQMELCEGGNLATYLDDYCKDEPIEETQIWRVLVDVAQGLHHIHSRSIAHLDVKPENIFITRAGALKLGDFGMASFSPVPRGADREGDRSYLAPEVLSDAEVTCAADIFSLGLILLEIAAHIILPENGPAWKHLREGNFSDVSLAGRSQAMIDFIQSMMQPDPALRPTAQDVLAHPLLASFLGGGGGGGSGNVGSGDVGKSGSSGGECSSQGAEASRLAAETVPSGSSANSALSSASSSSSVSPTNVPSLPGVSSSSSSGEPVSQPVA